MDLLLNDNNNIIFSDDITQDNCRDLYKVLYDHKLKILDTQASLRSIGGEYAPPPITLCINSFGGSVREALRLYDLISTMNVDTIATGSVMSAAVIIFLAGKKRYSTPRSTFMIHQISVTLEGMLSGIQEDLEEINRLQTIFDSIIISKTIITKKDLEDVYREKRDWYINTLTAKDLGIIDDVIIK